MAPMEDAMLGAEDAENRFKFISKCVGASDPLQSLHPSGKQNHSILLGNVHDLIQILSLRSEIEYYAIAVGINMYLIVIKIHGE